MKKKLVVGLLFSEKKIGYEEKLFLKCAKKKGIELKMINLFKRFNEEEFEQQIRQCDVVYNNAGEGFVLEPLKTIEELGERVIDSSKLYYYTEDKWMFYVKCKEHGIPTPKTILIPNNLTMARAELKEFGQWPVILKRIYGMEGQCVAKADHLTEAVKIVKSIWSKDIDKLPLIAQEYIKSWSYRVTVIDGEIVQAIIKKSSHWKCTGVYSKDCEKFRVDVVLRKLVKKVIRATQINVCGIDFLKHGNEWVVLEVNTEPGLAFVDGDYEKLVNKILDFIKRYSRKTVRKLITSSRSTF
ncbi:ATP-grasp domain-containing protein [Candidatus Peregrinibacteria bacterium]|nr:ATP-grasp domain-containing protein [Candidatus Peregrinibacteria bacterium]